MSTETVDYLDAIAHLPMGATLLLSSVSWEEYEALLSDLTDRPGLRVTAHQREGRSGAGQCSCAELDGQGARGTIPEGPGPERLSASRRAQRPRRQRAAFGAELHLLSSYR